MIRRSCRGPSGVFESQNAKPFLLGDGSDETIWREVVKHLVPKDVDQDEARVEMPVEDDYEAIGTGMNHSGPVI